MGGSYLWGQFTKNDYLRDTGFLAGEAAANSFLVSEALKYPLGRQRPTEGNGKGDFFSGGQSFPSEHAAAAWSIATVVANRYPGFLPSLLSYGAASAITISRMTGRNHFASDVFVGSALGWYFGRETVRKSADKDSGYGEDFERNPETVSESESRRHDPDYMASPYVPLDSWVYPAFDRLAALGVAPTAFAGLRPWTDWNAHVSSRKSGHVESDMVQNRHKSTTLSDEFCCGSSPPRRSLEPLRPTGLDL